MKKLTAAQKNMLEAIDARLEKERHEKSIYHCDFPPYIKQALNSIAHFTHLESYGWISWKLAGNFFGKKANGKNINILYNNGNYEIEIKEIIDILKDNNLMSAEIEQELFPLIFGKK